MASNDPSSARPRRLAPPSTPGRATATTPSRRTVSVEPLSARQSARRNAATPHARAVFRAMDQRRRTIFTPGRARRRSLRDQRETPHDILRNLSRVLAPTSQAMRYSSSSSSPRRDAPDSTRGANPQHDDDDDDDDDFPIERPRFSLPLHEDDDDDSDLKAPRLSGLEEENYTATSIELPRRAWGEGQSRLGRESLGSVWFSDYAGPELRSDDVGVDSGFFPPPAMEDDSGNVMMDEGDVLERIDADEMRRQTLGRDSLFGPIEIPEGGNESTFMMAGVESPTRDPNTGEFDDDNDDADDAGGDGADASGGVEVPEAMEDYDDDHVNEPMDWPDSDDNGNIEAPADDHDEVEQQDETILSQTAELPASFTKRRGTGKQISRYGIEYPLLPKGVVKRLATTFAKTSGAGKAKISADTMDALMQATDWFFEQLGDDLRAYARHAGRTTINESDMVTLMRRQRQTSVSTTPFALAQRYLPRELLQALRMPTPAPIRKSSKKKSSNIDAEEGEDVT